MRKYLVHKLVYRLNILSLPMILFSMFLCDTQKTSFTCESIGNIREMRLISSFSLANFSHLLKHSMSLRSFPFESRRENKLLMESSFCPYYMTYLTFEIMDRVVKRGNFLTMLIKMIFDFPFLFQALFSCFEPL